MNNIEIAYATVITKSITFEEFLHDNAYVYLYQCANDFDVQFRKVPEGSKFLLITYDVVCNDECNTIEVASLVIDTDEVLDKKDFKDYILKNKERLIDLREPE